ncbi:thioredoxin family protein [Nocardioides hankookensis]|uniref:Thioredoxin family protein n=1 Tax=Nocardioides hankookensis TaxID=443157 RepID=A0ABW1LLN1_9ACTN
MSSGAWVVVVAVVLGLGFGVYRLLTDGRFRGTREIPVVEEGALAPVSRPPGPWEAVLAALPDATLGEKATLLQFSSAFCAPCRATRRTLSEVAELVPGVEHLEVDAEHHLELARSLGILRTPTTLVLDAAGREVTRAAGAPRKEQVLAALGSAP